MVIQKLRQEKSSRITPTSRQPMMRFANQDEINKLNKEKLAGRTLPRARGPQVAGDKVDHLMKIKTKLESTWMSWRHS